MWGWGRERQIKDQYLHIVKYVCPDKITPIKSCWKKKIGHIYWWILFKLSVKFRRKIKRTVKEIHTILSRYWAFHLFFRKGARVPESFTNTLSIILLFSRNRSGNRILWCVAMLLKCCFSFSWTLKKWCRLNSVWNKE